MKLNLVGPFQVNFPFGTEIAFAKGLRRIGHEVFEVDPNIDREMAGLNKEADATVVFKSCVGAEKFLHGLHGPIVVYQPDDARFPHIREMMVMMRGYADLFLSFDSHGADVARSMGYRAAETLLLTADDELYCPSFDPIERDIDVSFVGSLGDSVAHASRRLMLEIVQHSASKYGWKTDFRTSQDIPIVRDIYRRSKVVLNHATNVGQPFGWGYGYQCRHFETGMCRTLLLSNCIYGSQPPDAPMFVSFEDSGELNDKLDAIISGKGLLNDPDELGEQAYRRIEEHHMPEDRAIQLAEFIKRNSCG